MDSSNRRRHARALVNPDILVSNDFRLVDLSESGVQLAAIHPRKVGSTIPLVLDIDGQQVNLRAVVRWCKQSHSIFSTDYNMGLQFEGILVNHTLILRRYINETLMDGRKRA
jgi:hypothetical protein